MEPKRCSWVTSDPLYQQYHDQEWGIPVHDSQKLFEMLCLEGAQAGLSWITVLKKRENYRLAFRGFDPLQMADFDETIITELLEYDGIIRHRGKIEAFIANAKAYLQMQDEGEDFAEFLWSFAGKEEPAAAMSKALKKKGFKFVGATTCYAFMQAAGMVNDHEADCFKSVSLHTR